MLILVVYLFVYVCVFVCVLENKRGMLENFLGIFRKRRRCDEPRLATQPNVNYDTGDNNEDENDEQYARSPEWTGAYISNLQIDR